MPAPRELRVNTPFGELAALEWGAAESPPLLALHGWLDNAASFTSLAPRLAAGHRLIALDLPGHGHSAHLPPQLPRYHVVDQVEPVLAFTDALGLDRFDLLGHSLGAGIAALIASAAPARITRLLLIEGLGPLADAGNDTLARWREAHAQTSTPRRAARVFTAVADAIAARVAAGGLSAEEARPLVERNLLEVPGGFGWRSDPRLRRATPLRTSEAQVRALLAGIAAPSLLLLAEPATPYLPTALLAARAACVADIQVAHLPGPHHLHLRHPNSVADLLLEFLARRVAQRP